MCYGMGNEESAADFDRNGAVDFFDYRAFVETFGLGCCADNREVEARVCVLFEGVITPMS